MPEEFVEVKEDIIGKNKDEIQNITKEAINAINQKKLEIFLLLVNDSLINIKKGEFEKMRIFIIREHIMYQNAKNPITATKYYETLENGTYLRFKVPIGDLFFDNIYSALKDKFHSIKLSDCKEEILFVVKID